MGQKHTPGPWEWDDEYDDNWRVNEAGTGNAVAIVLGTADNLQPGQRQANAARIVAAVNFCEGYSTEHLEVAALKEVVEAIRLAVTELPVHDFNLSLRQESCPDCQPGFDECSWKSYRATQITLAKLEDSEG